MLTKHVTFLDESGDHSLVKIDKQYPVFALSSISFSTNYYVNDADIIIDNLKMKYWGHKDVILHSSDIRKRRKEFSILADINKERSFQNDLSDIMRQLDYTVIACAINKINHKDKYCYPMCPYELTLVFIMERLYYLMKTLRSSTYLIFEARNASENNKLSKVFNYTCKYGTNYIRGEEICKYIKGITFMPKKSNENGLQIADLVTYPIARYAIGRAQDYRPYEIISDKLYKSASGCLYGLKIFP